MVSAHVVFTADGIRQTNTRHEMISQILRTPGASPVDSSLSLRSHRRHSSSPASGEDSTPDSSASPFTGAALSQASAAAATVNDMDHSPFGFGGYAFQPNFYPPFTGQSNLDDPNVQNVIQDPETQPERGTGLFAYTNSSYHPASWTEQQMLPVGLVPQQQPAQYMQSGFDYVQPMQFQHDSTPQLGLGLQQFSFAPQVDVFENAFSQNDSSRPSSGIVFTPETTDSEWEVVSRRQLGSSSSEGASRASDFIRQPSTISNPPSIAHTSPILQPHIYEQRFIPTPSPPSRLNRDHVAAFESSTVQGRQRGRESAEAKSAPKRKGALTEATRAKANKMRKKKACLRCRYNKEDCDEGSPCCSGCERVINGGRSFWTSCHQDHLDDDQFAVARRGNGRFQQQRVSFFDLTWCEQDVQVRPETISWILPGATSALDNGLPVNCHRFIPSATGDELTVRWSCNGIVTHFATQPFAVRQTDMLKRSVIDFLHQNQPQLELELVRAQAHNPRDRAALREAFRVRDVLNSEPLSLALRISCASLASQGKGYLQERSSLGARFHGPVRFGPSQYEKYQGSPDRLIPMVLDHQIDVCLLTHAQDLQKSLVTMLKERIFKKKRKAWYELYLATFVITLNLEYIYQGAYNFAYSQAGTSSASGVLRITGNAMQQYEWSARNLLAHFRVVNGGHVPFTVDDKKWQSLKAEAKLDDTALEYVRSLRQNLNSTARSASYVGPKKWVDQMFREPSTK